MAERMTLDNVMTAEEALKTEIILNQALIDILIKKEIITVEEMVDGIREIKKEHEAMTNDWDTHIRQKGLFHSFSLVCCLILS